MFGCQRLIPTWHKNKKKWIKQHRRQQNYQAKLLINPVYLVWFSCAKYLLWSKCYQGEFLGNFLDDDAKVHLQHLSALRYVTTIPLQHFYLFQLLILPLIADQLSWVKTGLTEATASLVFKSNTNSPHEVRSNAGMQGQRRDVHRFKYTRRGGAQVKQIRLRLTVLVNISSKQESRCGTNGTKNRSFGINKIFWKVPSVLCVWEHKKKNPNWHDVLITVLKPSCPYQRLKQLAEKHCC